jgi:hypothetical protein
MAPAPPPEIVEVETVVSLQPITADMIHRIGTKEVPHFQFYISNQVILLRENNELRSRNTGKGLELTNAFTRDIVTIDGLTKGEVVRVGTNNEGKMVLDACFEADSDASLRFIQSREGYFDLEIHEGTVRYDDMSYRILPAEMMTRLMINLESRNDVQDFNRYVTGREVEEMFYDSSDAAVDRQDWPRASSTAGGSGAELYEPVFFEPRGGQGYRVQVGAFTSMDHAREAFDRLVSAGFNPDYEQYRNYYRVVISGIPEADISDITRRLSSAGFSDPWIRGEN